VVIEGERVSDGVTTQGQQLVRSGGRINSGWRRVTGGHMRDISREIEMSKKKGQLMQVGVEGWKIIFEKVRKCFGKR
jgi:hypothetical protein